MIRENILDIIGTIFLFIGFFLAFLPHAIHVSAGFNEASHIKHVAYGIAIVVIGLVILVYKGNYIGKNK